MIDQAIRARLVLMQALQQEQKGMMTAVDLRQAIQRALTTLEESSSPNKGTSIISDHRHVWAYFAAALVVPGRPITEEDAVKIGDNADLLTRLWKARFS